MWKLTGKLPKVAMPEEAASALGFDNGAYVELGFQVAGFGLQVFAGRVALMVGSPGLRRETNDSLADMHVLKFKVALRCMPSSTSKWQYQTAVLRPRSSSRPCVCHTASGTVYHIGDSLEMSCRF